MSWAAEKFATVDLGDKQLNKRLVKVVQQWADKPTQSIPTAAGVWGDTAAAYRMLDNKCCDWREVLEAHSHCTTQRMAALPVVRRTRVRHFRADRNVGCDFRIGPSLIKTSPFSGRAASLAGRKAL